MFSLQKCSFILTPLFLSVALISGCHDSGQRVVAPVSSSSVSVSQASSETVSKTGLKDKPSWSTKPVSDNVNKVAYLTFDDGPTEMTPKIIETLKQYQVKATFFVVYKSSEKLANYMKLASDEGNEIAAHSYCHNYKQIYRNVNSFMEDFKKVDQWIESVTGQRTKQLRFPGGSSIGKKYLSKPVLNGILSALHDKGITHHDWNVSSGDANSKAQSKDKILENIKKEALKFDEPVILMHDVERNQGTLEALPEIIEWLRAKGYSFDTVSNIKHPAQHRAYSPNQEKESSQQHISVISSAPLPSVSSKVIPGVSSAISVPSAESDMDSSDRITSSFETPSVPVTSSEIISSIISQQAP